MENSHIEWTDHTFNGWIGCTKVSPGCAHCYAEARDQRFNGGIHWGKGAPRQRTSASNWNEPRRWNRAYDIANAEHRERFETEAQAYDGASWKPLRRPRVFSASLSDWLDDEVPIEWLADFLQLVGETQNLDWLLLTKRPENWRRRVTDALVVHENNLGGSWLHDWLQLTKEPPANVWVGTSVENQECADRRIPELLKIPARVLFLSCEPLLGPINLTDCGCGGAFQIPGTRQSGALGVHWVIVGGESGKDARPMDVDWARSLVAQCKAVGVAPFVKQLGAQPFSEVFLGRTQLYDTGMRRQALKLKDKKGGDMLEWPDEFKVREFPV